MIKLEVVQKNVPYDMLSHCIKCEAKCCHDNSMTLTSQEYSAIMSKNYHNHFAEVALPEGRFYVLEYAHKPCPYLNKQGQCTIEEVKPNTCRAYPAKTMTNDYGQFREIALDYRCPAKKSLPVEEQEKALAFAQMHRENINLGLRRKIMLAYTASYRHNQEQLNELQAKVTMPEVK